MSKYLLVSSVLIAMIVLVGTCNALESVPSWDTRCINSTSLYKESNIRDTTDGSCVVCSNQTLTCPFDCDQNRDTCNKWPGGYAIPGEQYIIFFILAISLLVFGIFRLDVTNKEIRPLDLILPLISIMLFATLSLQSMAVIDMTTGEAVELVMNTWFCFGMSGLSLVWFVFSLFKMLGKQTGEMIGKKV